MKRSDLLKWSAAASAKPPVKIAVPKSPPLRMRTISAVIDLERHLLLYGPDHPETYREALSVCKSIFGIEPDDTKYELPSEFWTLSDYDPEKWRLNNLWANYENEFETGDDLTDDETAEVLAGFGFDFTDDRGHPLRCAKLFARVAECAVKGIKGKLPDRNALQLARLEETLAKDRDVYLANKRKRGLS